jgi:DNA-binding MarR family transcriptional regulator
MSFVEATQLEGVSLEAWRAYLTSHAAILRELDAELLAEQSMTTRDFEVLLFLSHAPDRRLPMLTRSGITRLVDGLVAPGYVERTACQEDARISYAHLTDVGYEKLRQAGCSHVASVRRLFVERFSAEEVSQLADLLGRLPGAQRGGSCTAP